MSEENEENEEEIEWEEDAEPTSVVEARGPRSEARYPLAFDANGNPLALPPAAVAWRVRRGGGRRGRPRHVFDPASGRQLEVPLGASLEDLLDAGCPPDRYLLYPIDAGGNILPGIVGVTEVSEGAAEAEESAGQVASEQAAVSALLATIKDKQGTIDQQHETFRHMATCLTRCFEAATAGYGRVRALPDPPVIIEQPAATPPQPTTQEQMTEYFKIGKMIFDMFQGAGGGGAAPAQGGGS